MPDITLDNIKSFYAVMVPHEEQVDHELPTPTQEFVVLKDGLLAGIVFRINGVSTDSNEELVIDYTVVGNYGDDDMSGLFTQHVNYFDNLLNLIVVDMILDKKYVPQSDVLPIGDADSLEDADGDFIVDGNDFPYVTPA